jgi:hypothetical protein
MMDCKEIEFILEGIASSLFRIANSLDELVENSKAKQSLGTKFPWDDHRVYIQMRSPLFWRIPIPETVEGMIGIGRKRILAGGVVKRRPEAVVEVLDAIFNDAGMSQEWMDS